jgi:2,4-dienoyl-CoA reductase-like NADH-dependent reductase (Old Yellow Enzyme family)
MKQIFEPLTIGPLTVKNRLVRSATWENLADDQGRMTPAQFKLYEELARGGVGLIITGYAFIFDEERANPGMMGIHDDSLIADYRTLTNRVHELGGKIVMQIAYGGSQTGYPTEGREIWGPSAVADLATGVVPTPMTQEHINRLIEAFAAAAERVKQAGFDGVELHGAHNYLLNQFFNPYYNRRQDQYGGSVENRARLTVEVYEAVRQRVGEDFPVMIKINAEDFIPGGSTIDDSLVLAKLLALRGIDAIEVSGGTGASADKVPARMKINSPDKEAYHATYAAQIAEAVNVPIIVVGGLRSPEVIENLLATTPIELYSLSRPLLVDPQLPQRWQQGDRSPSRCLSCNYCMRNNAAGVHCILTKER